MPLTDQITQVHIDLGGSVSFIQYFNALEDGRTDINITYDLLDVVFLTVVALLSGAEGWQDIQRFGDAKLTWLRQHRAFTDGIPRRHTIARIIGAINPDDLLACFVAWVNEVRLKNGQTHIAIDGKTLRRSHDGDKNTALHLLSAMVVDSGLVIYQQPSAGKKNEIKTVQQLLDTLDIRETCVTLDAMHCQTATVKKIRLKSADYVIQVKANQQRLYEEIQAFFHKSRRDAAALIARSTFDEPDKGHGRIEQRHYVRLDVTPWLASAAAWTDLRSVIEVTRTIHRGATTREETSYYITSLTEDSQLLAAKIRRHWHIENGQHWVLDVIYKEDDSRIRVGDAPQNMALFRRFAFNLAKLSSVKDSMKGKLKRAAWDDAFRTTFIFG